MLIFQQFKILILYVLSHNLPGVKNARKFIKVKNPTKLYDGIYSTGKLKGIEHSQCVKIEKGIVLNIFQK